MTGKLKKEELFTCINYLIRHKWSCSENISYDKQCFPILKKQT